MELASAPRDLFPRPAFTAGLTIATDLADLQQLADLSPNWRSEYVSLGGGRFSGTLRGVHTANLQLGIVEYSCGYSFQGDAPPGCFTFVMPLHGEDGGVYRSKQTGELDLVTARAGEELAFFSPGATKKLVISVASGLFERIAAALWWRLDGDFSKRTFRFMDIARRFEFLAYMQRLLEDALLSPRMLVHPASAAFFEKQVVEKLLSATAPTMRVGATAERHRVAGLAHSFMRDRVQEGFSLGEMCESVKANERTLLLGFQETYGAAPIAYLRRLRLTGARRDLARGRDTVTNVASRWGFLHFGRFSADYRRAFGESPSETLHIARTLRVAV